MSIARNLSRLAALLNGNGQVTVAGLVSDADFTINGLRVGKGAGGVATNTAAGVSALAANTSGDQNTAVGQQALTANTTGAGNSAVGRNALVNNTTGAQNTAIGLSALQANTTANNNTSVGFQAAFSNVTGTAIVAVGQGALYNNTASNNTALGKSSLNGNTSGVDNSAGGKDSLGSNTTGSYNTAFGSNALVSNTTASFNTAVGYQAAYANSTGERNAVLGNYALFANTTGSRGVAVGMYALGSNTTGLYNVALGYEALVSNTTANNSTAVGYQAGYNNTANSSVFVGFQAGYSKTTGGNNVFVGTQAGFSATTGTGNTFVGPNDTTNGSGFAVTTGSKNTIIGGYTGNQGGLDIRTASNYIVLSDGDGNPLFGYNAGGLFGWIGNAPQTAAGSQASLVITGQGNGNHVSGTRNTLWLRNNNASGNQSNFFVLGSAGTGGCIIGNDLPANGTAVNTLFVQAGGSGGVNLTSGATSWTSASDARLKNVTGTYTNALADIAQIEAVKFTWKSDAESKPQVGVIAQSVQAVVPEAVDSVRVSKDDETDYLSVRYTDLIPLMIAAIKELKTEIDTLKGQA